MTLFDNEYHDNQKQDLIEFCEGADLVVWDGMFTEENYFRSKVGDTLQLKELRSLKSIIVKENANYTPFSDRTDVELDEIGKTLNSNIEFAYETKLSAFTILCFKERFS